MFLERHVNSDLQYVEKGGLTELSFVNDSIPDCLACINAYGVSV